LLPLSLKLVEQNLLSLDELIARLTLGPARILGLDLGHLSGGARADICLFDPGAEWQLTEENSRSRGLNTPFLNQTLKGQVRYTLLKGEVVFEGG
jgi:dihydroorotase